MRRSLRRSSRSAADKNHHELNDRDCDIICYMREKHRNMSTRIIRDGREPRDDTWKDSSPEERIEAVWTLTKLCLAWNNQQTDEPRLQRTVTRLQRGQR